MGSGFALWGRFALRLNLQSEKFGFLFRRNSCYLIICIVTIYNGFTKLDGRRKNKIL